jgi:hypothetical protein
VAAVISRDSGPSFTETGNRQTFYRPVVRCSDLQCNMESFGPLQPGFEPGSRRLTVVVDKLTQRHVTATTPVYLAGSHSAECFTLVIFCRLGLI